MNEPTDSTTFWDRHYARLDAQWGTRPNQILADLVTDLAPTPGTALDLGCGHGGDSLWLASHGWDVTAVDVSATALSRVAASAHASELTDRVHTGRHDLAHTFPEGSFDLVSACYFHTPIELPRQEVLRWAARAVDPSGLVIIHRTRLGRPLVLAGRPGRTLPHPRRSPGLPRPRRWLVH